MRNIISYIFIISCILIMHAFGAQDSIIIDNSDSLFSSTGSWNISTRDKPFHGENYLWARKSVKSTATWTLPISKDGEFEIFIWFCASMDDDRSSNANYTINHKGGSKTITISQKPSIKLNNRWHSLGVWEFSASAEKSARNITLDNSDADHSVSADAVKAVYIPKTNIAPIVNTNNHNPFITLHGTESYTISWGKNIKPTSAGLYQIPTGKLIYKWTDLSFDSIKKTFTLGKIHLASGIYTLALRTDDHIIHLNFLKGK